MAKRGALAELRALRAAGKTRLDSYQVEEEKQLYEEVDEEGYKKVVRSRLDQDDFVVDDNGEGYADDGREDWDTERLPQYDSESEEERPLRGKAGTRIHPLRVLTQSTILTPPCSQEEAGRGPRKTRESKKRYQQVFQRTSCYRCF